MAKRPERPQFDLVTHVRDKESGKVSASNPYRYHSMRGLEVFERPPMSKNFFYRNGEAVPQEVLDSLDNNKRIVLGLAPIDEIKVQQQVIKDAATSSKKVSKSAKMGAGAPASSQ